jgi:polyhydroxyalkanoate synthesis regulator phasin
MTTTSTHAHTDLNDILEQCLIPEIQMEICNAVVWRAGSLIVTDLQRLLREIKEAHAELPDMTPEALANLIRDDEFLAQCLTDAGMSSTARVQRIADLMLVRNRLIEVGTEAAHLSIGWDGNPRTFRFTSIGDELEKPVSANVSDVAQRRIAMDVDRNVAKGKLDAARADKRKDELLARAQEQASQTARAIKSQRDAVIKLWGTVDAHVERNGAVGQEFCEMDSELQLALLASTMQGIERARDNARSDRRMTDGTYNAYLDEFDKLEELVNAVISTRKE